MPRSRASNPPLYGFPGRTYEGAEELNLNPKHSKNVPIFAALRSAEKNRQGRESGAPALGRRRNLEVQIVKVLCRCQVRAWGFSRGGFGARERDMQRPLS